MEDVSEKGQIILLFAFIIVIIILTLSYVHAQNVIAGMESSRTMLAYPKEEIRNLVEIQQCYSSHTSYINRDIQILCAAHGWVCYVGVDKVEFKNAEVEYCEGSC